MNYNRKKIPRLVVLVFFVHISGVTPAQNTDSLKCWSQKDKLKWCDFKGKIPGDDDRAYLNATSAIQLIPARTRKNGLLSYDIKLVFMKYKSWTTDTAKHLLSHEQLHFDIAELYARKLRKAIQGVSESKQNPTEEVFNDVIQELYLEVANMQTKYDEETIHGIVGESQIAWEKKIFLELKKLEKYASTSADCQIP